MKFYKCFKNVIMQTTTAVIYFSLAELALNFATISGNVTLIWPSSGFALAVMLKFGKCHALGVFLGAFAAGYQVGNPHYVSALIAFGNTLEPLTALYLLRFFPFSANLYHIHDYRSLLIAGLLSSMVSGFFGVTALLIAGFISTEWISATFINWWMSDTIGILLITPTILLANYRQLKHACYQRILECISVLILSVVISIFVLTDYDFSAVKHYKGSFWLVIPLFWSVLRFGQMITALITVGYFFIGIYGLTIQQGIFIDNQLVPNLPLFRAYFFVIAIGGTTIAFIIHQRNTLFQALDNSQTEIFIFCSNDMSIEYVNKAILERHHMTTSQALAMTPFELNPLFNREEFNEILDDLSSSEDSSYHFETLYQNHNRKPYPVEVKIQAVNQKNEHCYIVMVNDISDRVEKEAVQRMGNYVCDLSPQGIMITNQDKHIIRVNQAFTDITGYQAHEILGEFPSILSSGVHDIIFYQKLWDSINDKGIWEGEIYNRRKNGELYLQQLTIKALKNSLGHVEYYIAMFTDITEQHEKGERLKHRAEHDMLTGLPNRFLLEEKFNFAHASAKRHQKKLAILFLDLDDFKLINDTFSHSVGDKVLQTIAERLQSCLRAVDMVSRIGGDEFVILLSDISDKNASLTLSDKIKHAVAEPIAIEKDNFEVKVSIGSAMYPDDGEEFEVLMQQADLAMYSDKAINKT